MCGFAGVFELSGASISEELLKGMANILAHRGPDGEGFYRAPGIGLAHRRLAIIDLERGIQPMTNEMCLGKRAKEKLVVAYNGEIYNYRDIQKDLKARRHHFSTDCDTEVILHAYEEFGWDSILRFNGMFSFALWEESAKRLTLVRDRLGIKPLYWGHFGKRLVFASEIKAILLDESVPREPNLETIIDFTTFQNVLDEKTFFQGIQKLLPGHYLVADASGVKTKQYWDAQFEEVSHRPVSVWMDSYRETLRSSVERHLVSDVPVGSYLSGGFDSSSVSTFAREKVSGDFHTFTGYFSEGDAYDERPAARSVASKINAISHEICITATRFQKEFRKVIYHLDEPTLGTGAFPQYCVANLVSQRIKVILTGHGGDELFAGYAVYKAALLRDRGIFGLYPFLAGLRWSELPRLSYFLFGPLLWPELKHGLFIMFGSHSLPRILGPRLLSSLPGYDPMEVINKLLRNKQFSNVDKTLYLYLKTYLPTLFIQEDKVSMAHSIEARTPICDNEMVDLALSMPPDVKLSHGTLKYVPREAMRNYFPETLYRQPKRGFPTPFARWFRDELLPMARETLLSPRARSRGIFSAQAVELLLEKHISDRSEGLWAYARANSIYSLMAVETWFRIFMDGEKPE